MPLNGDAGPSSIRSHALVWLLISAGCLYFARGNLLAGLPMIAGLSILAGLLAGGTTSTSKPTRLVSGMAYLLVAIPSLLLLGIYALYVDQRGAVGPDQVRAIAQTYAGEASSYLKSLLLWQHGLIGAAGGLLLATSFPVGVSRTGAGTRDARIRSLLMFAAAAALFVLGGRAYYGPIVDELKEYQAEVAAFRQLAVQAQSATVTDAKTGFSGTVIMVIGESTSRHHMGLYGYWRDTTPELRARLEQLVVFEDVVSPHSHTVPALMSAFTSSGSSREADYFSPESVDIISLARAARYETFWFSNQNEFGLWDNPVSLLAKRADHVEFISSSMGRSFARTRPDFDLITRMEEALAAVGTGPKLVVLHLFATHFPYCANFPPEDEVLRGSLGPDFWGRAMPRPDINCYDNSVRRVDRILGNVLDAAEAVDSPVATLYFSDHGEAPLLGTGHESSMYSSYHVEIPFFLHANEAFRRVRPEFLASAADNRTQPYGTASLFHSLAELMDIDHASVRPEDSIFSRAFHPRNRKLMDETVRYDVWGPHNDDLRNSLLALRSLGDDARRVWAHRVDSVGAALEAKRVFDGIEMDVVFYEDCTCFRVHHPPVPDTGLGVATMLEALHDRPDMGLWLDWKNASQDNLGKALEALEALDRSYGLRNRTLIETGPDAVFTGLRELSRRGFNHGYYLPTEAVLAVESGTDGVTRSAMAEQIRSAVVTTGAGSITYDWRLNGFVEGELSGFLEANSLGRYAWHLGLDLARDPQATRELSAIMIRPGLRAMLVPFRGHFWY